MNIEMTTADMLPYVRAALVRVASGDAVSLPLRTMALRALAGQDVRNTPLNRIRPDRDELAQLDRMHKRAFVRMKRR